MYYYPQGAVAAPQFAPQGWVSNAVTNNAPLIGSGVGGITTQLTGSPAVGGIVGGLTNQLARDFGHLIPFQAGPGAPVQYAPQGFWGNLVSDVAPVVGQHVGGNAGRVISTVGGLADMLPFQAGPAVAQQPVYAPMGAGGNMLGGLVGGAIGNHFGHRDIGATLGGLAGSFLPFQAGPGAPVQYAPQGFWGNLVSDVAPVVGQHVGGNAGRVISTVGGLADMLPFQAGPQMVQQGYAPQGMWGNLISGLGGAVGNAVGGNTGQAISGVTSLGNLLPFQAGPMTAPQTAYAPQGLWGNLISGVGGAVGNAVGGNAGQAISGISGLGSLLPFQAGPQMAPQGMWGNLISGVGGAVGNAVGGNAGQAISGISGLGNLLPFQAGPQIAPQGMWGNLISGVGNAVGGAVGGNAGQAISGISGLGSLLPFQAGPQMAPQGYAPQGMWGNLISGVGGAVGNAVGGNAGQAISGISGLGNLLPFQAGPQLAPQGIFGSIGGSLLGGAIGNALGNKGIGSAIGGIAGGFLPFQAGPGAPIQYVPVQNVPTQTDQLVYH